MNVKMKLGPLVRLILLKNLISAEEIKNHKFEAVLPCGGGGLKDWLGPVAPRSAPLSGTCTSADGQLKSSVPADRPTWPLVRISYQ